MVITSTTDTQICNEQMHCRLSHLSWLCIAAHMQCWQCLLSSHKLEARLLPLHLLKPGAPGANSPTTTTQGRGTLRKMSVMTLGLTYPPCRSMNSAVSTCLVTMPALRIALTTIDSKCLTIASEPCAARSVDV